MKHFNLKNIKEGLQRYPDLSRDILYNNTIIDPDHFNSLQHYIQKSIRNRNVTFQIWSEHITRYNASHSKKQNITISNPTDHLDDDALNQQYFFALPTALDSDDVVQLI